MIAGVSGKVIKVAKRPVSDTWYVSVKVTPTFIQTYTGFTRKPKICVGDKVKVGDEIK